MTSTKTFSLLSDPHGNLSMQVDPCDFLLISGDIVPYPLQHDMRLSMVWFVEVFIPWLKIQPATHKIFIAGNHDFFLEKTDDYTINRAIGDSSIHYLNDSDVVIDGIKFYGSPWTPWLWDWAFNLPKDDLDGSAAREHWNKIPTDIDVLLTHGPPSNILDHNHQGQGCGCPDLKIRIPDLTQLKLHVFGHVHEGFGMRVIDGVTFCNAAYGTYLKEGRRPQIAPKIEIDLSK